MRTWEVYKNELEQPKQIYFRKSDGVNYCFDVNGVFAPCEWREVLWLTIKTDDDWELVPKEVTWQEAIQAWLDGKEIYFIDDNNQKREIRNCNLFIDDGVYVHREHITKGKWFIK